MFVWSLSMCYWYHVTATSLGHQLPKQFSNQTFLVRSMARHPVRLKTIPSYRVISHLTQWSELSPQICLQLGCLYNKLLYLSRMHQFLWLCICVLIAGCFGSCLDKFNLINIRAPLQVAIIDYQIPQILTPKGSKIKFPRCITCSKWETEIYRKLECHDLYLPFTICTLNS